MIQGCQQLARTELELHNQTLNKYIKNKIAIYLSVVPENQLNLALTGSEKAYIKEEQVVQGAEKQFQMKYGIKLLLIWGKSFLMKKGLEKELTH